MAADSASRRRGAQTIDQRRHDGPVALVAEILKGTAPLHGAACTADPALFDLDVHAETLGYPDEAARWAAVQRVCISCPARGRCWAWSSELTAARQASGPVATTRVNPFPISRAFAERPPRVQDPEPDEPGAGPGLRCIGRGCSRPVVALNVCEAHYRRIRRRPNADPAELLAPLRRPPQHRDAPPPRSRGARSRVRPSRHRRR